MTGMIDGRRLKRAWDGDELGALLLGSPPYDFEADADEAARFTRLRQVTDFLRCQPPAQRQPRLLQALATLERAEAGWAQAAAIFLRHAFALPLAPPGDA